MADVVTPEMLPDLEATVAHVVAGDGMVIQGALHTGRTDSDIVEQESQLRVFGILGSTKIAEIALHQFDTASEMEKVHAMWLVRGLMRHYGQDLLITPGFRTSPEQAVKIGEQAVSSIDIHEKIQRYLARPIGPKPKCW